MFVIEVFLPLSDNDGHRFPESYFDMERSRLADRFGGLTVYSRAPATGLWAEGGGKTADDIVVFEVMADEIPKAWLAAYRRDLQLKFRQDVVLIRATEATII